MATVPYSTLLPELLQYAPSVPEIIATNAVRNACVEFGMTTRYFQQDMTPMDITVGNSSYTIADPSSDLMFVDVMEAWANNALLIGKAQEELARIYRYQDWRTVQGAPVYMTKEVRNVLILVPQPTVLYPAGLTARIAVAPSRTSVNVDAEFYNLFLEIVVNGALGRLYSTPDQPYSNPQMAMAKTAMFRHQMTEVQIAVNRGLSRTPTRIEYQRFG